MHVPSLFPPIKRVLPCLRLLVQAISILLVLFSIQLSRAQDAGVDGNGPFRSQVIQLEAGWNAVYIDLEPIDGDLAAVFKGSPVEIVASYFRPVTSMEFIDSPDDVLPDRKSWSVWYAPHRDDAVLSNLNNIQAHHSYLIYSEQAYSLSVKGVSYFDSTKWYPNSYGLVGFPVNAGNQPTMSQFFDSALAQADLKIYTLRGGNWVLVTNPAAEMMQPNKAYWVYSKGASDFKGPIDVTFAGSSRGGVVFNADTTSSEVTIRNVSSYPQSLTMTLQHGESGTLPVSYVVRSLGVEGDPIKNVSIPFPNALEIGPVEPGKSFKLNLEVIQEMISQPIVSATLSISSSTGFRVDVPLISLRQDLVDGL